MSLRRNLSASLYVMGAVAMTAAVSLVIFSTTITRAVADLADALGSVYLAQRAEIDLLQHARAVDVYTRRTREDDLRQKLAEAKVYADTPTEIDVYTAATKHVDAYFERARELTPAATQNLPELQAASDSLHALVDTDMA